MSRPGWCRLETFVQSPSEKNTKHSRVVAPASPNTYGTKVTTTTDTLLSGNKERNKREGKGGGEKGHKLLV